MPDTRFQNSNPAPKPGMSKHFGSTTGSKGGARSDHANTKPMLKDNRPGMNDSGTSDIQGNAKPSTFENNNPRRSRG